jgi:hypothetical protein
MSEQKDRDELSDEQIEGVTGAGMSVQKTPNRSSMTTQGGETFGVAEDETTPGSGTQTSGGGISGEPGNNTGGLGEG